MYTIFTTSLFFVFVGLLATLSAAAPRVEHAGRYAPLAARREKNPWHWCGLLVLSLPARPGIADLLRSTYIQTYDIKSVKAVYQTPETLSGLRAVGPNTINPGYLYNVGIDVHFSWKA